MNLPDGNGVDLIPLLRAEHADLPIVFSTGHVELNLSNEKNRILALMKPYELSDLILPSAPSRRRRRNSRSSLLIGSLKPMYVPELMPISASIVALNSGMVRYHEHRGQEDPAEDEGPDHDLQSVERDHAAIVGDEIAHESFAGARAAARCRRHRDRGERGGGADSDQAEERRRDRVGFARHQPDEDVANHEQEKPPRHLHAGQAVRLVDAIDGWPVAQHVAAPRVDQQRDGDGDEQRQPRHRPVIDVQFLQTHRHVRAGRARQRPVAGNTDAEAHRGVRIEERVVQKLTPDVFVLHVPIEHEGQRPALDIDPRGFDAGIESLDEQA